MRTLVVIPARLGATRLPQKPLRDLAGRPLIVRVWERVAGMDLGDACVVATDDESVRKAAADAGAEVVMTSVTCESGTDRVAEVARKPEFGDFDVFVNVQGDEPFMSGDAVCAAKEMVTAHSFDVGTAAAPGEHWILDDPGIVKVVLGDDGRALYFSRAPIPYLRDRSDKEALEGKILQHLGVYVYTKAALERWVALPAHPLENIERLEQLRPLAAGITFGVAITHGPAYAGIDTEEDLADANARWAEISAR
ncbi:MAG: 3-deoxy-manno-octulosonate cytidylyltransferase [Gemmatimonadaceae bacterium]